MERLASLHTQGGESDSVEVIGLAKAKTKTLAAVVVRLSADIDMHTCGHLACRLLPASEKLLETRHVLSLAIGVEQTVQNVMRLLLTLEKKTMRACCIVDLDM